MTPNRFDVITFDCYGTLVDWERGIADAFASEASRKGTTFDGPAIVSAYHRIEPEVQAGTYRSYREILAEAAHRVASAFSWDLEPDHDGFLADSLPDWPPFPDTSDALRRLAEAGFRLGILSNVDGDLLAGTLRRLPDVFDADLIVTAQAVGSYKPAPGHFEEARRRIGARRWMHAAQSDFHDIRPAGELGIPAAWVNRTRAARPSDRPSPMLEVPTLAALADALVSTDPAA
ncbi:HAD family hydrolase [Tautonia plasticadhaerens]|uniref:(S)-2-haloacid dehalogenase n=1 Tax=Tautonia plasticadhaerens TaxID=2527974 RepID=A0A518H9H4_9BACT|nr:HAD family hydrolase [Tautonia plasticadhaerens]QDV37504.1 (S)-2-haloacid dehalogenase [Tautonia plasticadhaerens]